MGKGQSQGSLARLDLSKTTPRGLWKGFISQRKPVVIKGIEDCWQKYTNKFLSRHAGTALVQVEIRSSSTDSYGQGRKVSMTFREFLQRMAKGDQLLYMSTQEVPACPDGHPHIYGPPLDNLVGHFPLQHPLMGHLVPRAINMWMGCAAEGSSSGLHHDYHDNLYVLLRGKKRFRLWPPSAVHEMYTHGVLKKVYPNGRIVYEGQGEVLPDGSDARDVRAWKLKTSARKAAAAAGGGDGGSSDPEDAELQQLLQGVMEGEAGEEMEGFLDDYQDSDDDGDDDDDDDDGDDDRSSDEEGIEGLAGLSKESSLIRHKQQRQEKTTKENQTNKKGGQGNSSSSSGRKKEGSQEGPIPSFSRVNLGLPAAKLKRKFPLFPGVHSGVEVELEAGEMLYLPAGWFHEVTSFGTADGGGHLAVNYWLHPPDNLDPSKAGFKHPYTSQFLPQLWQQRLPWLLEQQQHQADKQRQQGKQQQQDKQQQQQDAPTAQHQQQQQQKAGTKAGSGKRPLEQQDVPATSTIPSTAAAAAASKKEPPTKKQKSSTASGSRKEVTESNEEQQGEHMTASDEDESRNGMLKVVRVGRRRVSWPDEVDSPRNKYHHCTTHPGTASGDPNKLPSPRSPPAPQEDTVVLGSAVHGADAAVLAEAEEGLGSLFGGGVESQAVVQQLLAAFMAARRHRRKRLVMYIPGRRHHPVVMIRQVPRPRALR